MNPPYRQIRSYIYYIGILCFKLYEIYPLYSAYISKTYALNLLAWLRIRIFCVKYSPSCLLLSPDFPHLALKKGMTYLLVMSDRSLGYAIICLFCVIFCVLCAYCLRPLLSPSQTRVVAFEKIGNLRNDDQVRFKGISYGTVKKIDLTRKKVFVSIQSRKPRDLHAGYSVITLDAGIMGDRMIMIDDGPENAGVIPPADTLIGAFIPGVSEAVGYMWRLRELVDSLRDMTNLLLQGDKRHRSLVSQTKTVIRSADSLSKSLLRFASAAESAVSSGLDSLDNIVKGATLLTQSVAASSPEFLSMLDKQITKAACLVASIDTGADRLLKTSAGLSKQDNVLWRNDLERLTGNLVKVQTAIAGIQKELLQFKIYLRLW